MSYKLHRGAPLRTRRKHYLVLAAVWLITVGPLVLCYGARFVGWKAPLILQVMLFVWVVIAAPSFEDLFQSYGNYVEEWRKDNELHEDSDRTQLSERDS